MKTNKSEAKWRVRCSKITQYDYVWTAMSDLRKFAKNNESTETSNTLQLLVN